MKAKLLFVAVTVAVGGQMSACGPGKVSFSQDIQPILDVACLECHTTEGEGTDASGFAVDNYDAVMKGTQFGPVVVPGSSASSALYLVVAGKTAPEIRMPPHHEESWAEGRGVALGGEQIDMIARWIDQGARNN